MKKALKITLGTALAVSALTPVAAFANEETAPSAVAKDGFYNITTGAFYTSADFKALSKDDQKAIIKDSDVYLVFKGTVYKGLDIALATSEELETAGVSEEDFEATHEIELTADGKILKDGVDISIAPAIKAAEDAITALPAVDALTLDDKAAVDAAQALVDAVVALDPTAVVANLADLVAAQAKIAELEKPVVELAVESVSAIEATIVEVTFPELVEAQTDVTVEVKDSKDVVREVVARDIAKGATKAQFDFATAVKAEDLTGVWTVNGVDYSFDELKLVQDIVKASAGTVNQVKLYSLLQEAGIENVDADRIADYAGDIDTADVTPVWASDVQKVVDATNKKAGEEAGEATVVKAVVDVTNQIQLLPVLEANFDRVNADWIAAYAAETVGGQDEMLKLTKDNYFGVVTTGVTADDIQAAIDTVNAVVTSSTGALTGGEIKTLNDAADTATKQAEVTSLIEKFVKADDSKTPNVTPKAKALAASKAKEAAFRVAEATTENSLYNALVAYANATPDATLKASELNANLKTEYKSAFDIHTKAQLITDIKPGGTLDIKADIVTAADTAGINAAIDNVGTTATAYDGAQTDATKKAAFERSLNKLADVTSHKTGDDKFDASKVDAELLVKYATAVKGFAVATPKTVKDIQDEITTANGTKDLDVAVKVVADANSTTVQVRDALTELALNESGNATATKYINASPQVKLEVAQFILDNHDSLEDPLTSGTIVADGDTSYAANAIGKAMKDHAAKVQEFNDIGDLSAADTAETKGFLDIYAHASYKDLGELQKLTVAEEINKLTKSDGATPPVITSLDFSGADAVTTLQAANDIIDAAIAAIQ